MSLFIRLNDKVLPIGMDLRCGLVVRISRSHRGGRGSIPRIGKLFCFRHRIPSSSWYPVFFCFFSIQYPAEEVIFSFSTQSSSVSLKLSSYYKRNLRSRHPQTLTVYYSTGQRGVTETVVLEYMRRKIYFPPPMVSMKKLMLIYTVDIQQTENYVSLIIEPA